MKDKLYVNLIARYQTNPIAFVAMAQALGIPCHQQLTTVDLQVLGCDQPLTRSAREVPPARANGKLIRKNRQERRRLMTLAHRAGEHIPNVNDCRLCGKQRRKNDSAAWAQAVVDCYKASRAAGDEILNNGRAICYSCNELFRVVDGHSCGIETIEE